MFGVGGLKEPLERLAADSERPVLAEADGGQRARLDPPVQRQPADAELVRSLPDGQESAGRCCYDRILTSCIECNRLLVVESRLGSV